MADVLKKIKWINVILFFSLALNFFIAGYVASDSKIFHSDHRDRMSHKRPEIMLVDYFPKEERRKIRRLMAKKSDDLKLSKKTVLKSQKEILALIGAAEVDEAALRNAFRQHQVSNDNFHSMVNDILVQVIMEMDYETRLVVIKRGRKAHDHWKYKKYKKRKEKKDHH